MAGREKPAWSHAANRDGTDLTELSHALIGIVLLDHLGVVIWMLDLDVLIQTSLRTIALGAVLNRTFVMSSDLGSRSSVSLLLFIIDFEWHTQNFLVFAFIRLKNIREIQNTYLKSVQLVSKVLLLIQ